MRIWQKRCSKISYPALVLFSFIVLIYGSAAVAQSDPTIIVQVKGQRGEVLAKRICKELKALGMNAMPLEWGDEIHSEQTTENVAAGNNAGAAISVELSKGVVDVWVADRITGKNVHRVSKIEATGQPEDTVVVVTAVELLRASLMEIHGPKRPDEGVEPTTQIENFAAGKEEVKEGPPKKTSLHIALGPSVNAGRFDMSLAMGLQTNIFVRVFGKVDVGLLGFVPIVPHSENLDAGKVKVTPGLMGGELGLPIPVGDSRLGFRLSGGGGGAWFSMRGIPEEGYVGYEVMKRTIMLFSTASASVKLSKRVSVRLDFLLAWARVSQVILARQDKIATLGRPWFSSSVLLEVAVF